MVTVFNTLTRAKEEIRPAHPDGKVRMYECGMTPYDEPHIGHARTAMTFDTLKRWLEYRGMPVIHVRNVTDIEDKIIVRAAERGVSTADLVAKFDAVRKELFSRLNLLPPTHEPYATAHIGEIVGLVERLVANGMAYVSGGDVYYAVRKFAGYGKLSKNSIEDLVPGARILPGELKRDPLDFDLWKAAKQGEPSWDSPWGKGRPGWHIECSAMSMKYLGDTPDIHGGANDLIFPHHENEIAQSEGAMGKPFVRIWVHSGFVTMNREKMSKSVGNVISLRDVLGRVDGSALRLLMAQTHYRAPLEYSEAAEVQARETFINLRRMLDLESEAPDRGALEETGKAPGGTSPETSGLESEAALRLRSFDEQMDDDLGAPRALAEAFGLAREFQRFRTEKRAALGSPAVLRALLGVRAALLERLGAVGILFDVSRKEMPGEVKKLVAERERARSAKDWKRADEIRGKLKGMGIIVEDTPGGTVASWDLKRAGKD